MILILQSTTNSKLLRVNTDEIMWYEPTGVVGQVAVVFRNGAALGFKAKIEELDNTLGARPLHGAIQ